MKSKKKKCTLVAQPRIDCNFLIHEKDCVILLDDNRCHQNITKPYIRDHEDEFLIKMFLKAKLNHII